MNIPSNPARPRSLFLSALLFGAMGLGSIGYFWISDFGIAAPLWIGVSLLVAGIGLFLGLRWGRGLASAMILCGYVSAVFFLMSATHPTDKTPLEIWQAYGLVFLAVALLTFVSGSLWSRSVSAYFSRFSDPAQTREN